MSDKKIILPKLRFKGAEESEMTLKVELAQESRHMVEGDRNVILDQSEQYDRERQKSEKYRLTGVIRPIWKNMTDVSTDNYEILNEMFFNNKYIEHVINTTDANTPDNLDLTDLRGRISSDEMDFVRRDFNSSNDPTLYSWYNSSNGFGPVFAGRINWGLYMTYPFEKVTENDIEVNFQDGNGTTTFDLSDGLPYRIEDMESHYEFYSPFPHGLENNSFVSIGGKVYSVDGIGNEKYRSEENYFSIYKGQFDSSFTTNNGTFKRVVEKNNPEETTSEYFLVNHKVLKVPTDFEIHKNAFESSIYEDEKEIQKYAVTFDPKTNTYVGEYANEGKVVVQELGDTYMFILNDELDIEGLVDHLGRPLTKVYLTTLHNNTMEMFNRQGFGYDNQFGLGNENVLIKQNQELHNGPTEKKVKIFLPGDTIMGAMYEYNPYDLTERKVSDRYNHLTYSDDFFDDTYVVTEYQNENWDVEGPGYYYNPHQEYKLKVFSDYIEESDTKNIYNLPTYASYIEKEQTWKWRDIWGKGYVNPDGLGVDYPFINGCHYINEIINFYIKPDTVDGLTNDRVKENRVNPFLIDDCE